MSRDQPISSVIGGFLFLLIKEIKRNDLKGPQLSIRYWRISITLGSGIAGFNCIYVHFSILYSTIAQNPTEKAFLDSGKIVIQTNKWRACSYLLREIGFDEGEHVVDGDGFEGGARVELGHFVFLVDLRVCTSLLKRRYEMHEGIQDRRRARPISRRDVGGIGGK